MKSTALRAMYCPSMQTLPPSMERVICAVALSVTDLRKEQRVDKERV